MNAFLKLSFFMITICLFSCKTTKTNDGKKETTATDDQNTSQVVAKNEKMKEKGYSKGVITVRKNAVSKENIADKKSTSCSYILTVEEYKDKLDPINLESFFKSEVPDKVWVKHSSLRMMNRCDEARPVSILDIVIRED